jgi:hypothetical protein
MPIEGVLPNTEVHIQGVSKNELRGYDPVLASQPAHLMDELVRSALVHFGALVQKDTARVEWEISLKSGLELHPMDILTCAEFARHFGSAALNEQLLSQLTYQLADSDKKVFCVFVYAFGTCMHLVVNH